MSVKSVIHKVLGKLSCRAYGWLCNYNENIITSQLGGGKKSIHYPFKILGAKNIIAEDNVSIGAGATIYTTGAKLIIKKHFVSGPNLTIITGDHMPIVGKFLDTVSTADKKQLDLNKKYDQDVVIEEDVWCGVNVTILKGVTIGRGAIIAAGAVVVNNIPPYTIAGGIPAKPLKIRWSLEQIMEHERALYPKEERYTKEEIERILNNTSKEYLSK